jgi:hypothetical protein
MLCTNGGYQKCAKTEGRVALLASFAPNFRCFLLNGDGCGTSSTSAQIISRSLPNPLPHYLLHHMQIAVDSRRARHSKVASQQAKADSVCKSDIEMTIYTYVQMSAKNTPAEGSLAADAVLLVGELCWKLGGHHMASMTPCQQHAPTESQRQQRRWALHQTEQCSRSPQNSLSFCCSGSMAPVACQQCAQEATGWPQGPR